MVIDALCAKTAEICVFIGVSGQVWAGNRRIYLALWTKENGRKQWVGSATGNRTLV